VDVYATADIYETGTSKAGGVGLVDSLLVRKLNVGNIGCSDNFGGACYYNGLSQRGLECMKGKGCWG
jgi:hypothetical protein